MYNRALTQAEYNRLQAAGQEEKAKLILENAKQQAKTERELNDFLAHEVRNPVAAAMSAVNFVMIEVKKPNPLSTPESREMAREDLTIIDNALHFVNGKCNNGYGGDSPLLSHSLSLLLDSNQICFEIC